MRAENSKIVTIKEGLITDNKIDANDTNSQTKDTAAIGKNAANKSSSKNNSTKEAIISTLTQLQKRFIHDESIFIQLPEDEMSLGKLTEEGQFNSMTGIEYIAFIDKLESQQLKDTASYDTQNFISNYYKHYEKTLGAPPVESKVSLALIAGDAFASLKEYNGERVKVLVTAYPELLKFTTCNNGSLFSLAIELNEHDVLKFLLDSTKGKFPYKKLFDLAKQRNNNTAIHLLNTARLYGQKKPTQNHKATAIVKKPFNKAFKKKVAKLAPKKLEKPIYTPPPAQQVNKCYNIEKF